MQLTEQKPRVKKPVQQSGCEHSDTPTLDYDLNANGVR
ncbi:hypothetical protein LMG27177_05872 [Paraburkholderia fynbosensis]|uniref:Uncharacterized protein n=1 Tax=Paraburkholderia fynbosensis TaxID=1200993 RepID=A0A6J5GR26_9BURK|nr:hypothetical protein LMG27177_05872 [Paraburkholderia fynbosensis]